MKIFINNRWSPVLVILTLIIGLGLWSCEEDESSKISVSPQRLPTVTSIDPSSGILGTGVTITGTNFTDVADEIELKFNGEVAVVTEATETSIVATVPSSATTGAITLRIGSTVLQGGGPTFTVPFPEVTSYDVASGIVGTVVIITGANFSSELADHTVSFNGVSAVVTASTPTTLTTTVPFGATTGAVVVAVDGQEGIGPEFVVPLPTINAYDITTGPTGAVVTITGTNFSANIADNVVNFFDGVEAEVTAATEMSLVTSVPAGASTGPISVNVGGQLTSGADFTVTATTLVIPLESNDDDVEEVVLVDPAASDPSEAVLGFIDLGSSDLEFGEISDDQGLVTVGLRFNNVAIPQGATVTDATIQFNCDKEGADPVEVTIFGENVGNAAAYDGTSGEVTARALTSANAVWNIPEWVSAGDRGDAQKTVDLSSIVQEIINRGDWLSGNSINFIIKNTGASANVTVDDVGREAENYSSSKPEDGAELTIKFTQ